MSFVNVTPNSVVDDCPAATIGLATTATMTATQSLDLTLIPISPPARVPELCQNSAGWSINPMEQWSYAAQCLGKDIQ